MNKPLIFLNLVSLLLALFNPIYAQDKSPSFGVIDDHYEVNAAGAYNHIIPLTVAPGINGLQPNLSLMYDSRAGTGPLGIGWALNGLSKVTRSGNNFAQHGETRPIRFSSKDAFLLDGQYLTLIEGKNGEANSKYRTENESFSIIWSVGSIPNSNASPSYFVVKQANGLTYYYGGSEQPSEDARLKVATAGGASEILEWHIKKIADPFGNYMVFEYKQNGTNAIRIESISYTGNRKAGISPSQKVVFWYLDAAKEQYTGKANLNYISGVPLKNENQLKSIGMMTNGKYFKYYHFTYDKSWNYLTAVKESFDEAGKKAIPETKITWTNKDSLQFERVSLLQTENDNFQEIDLNNDGRNEYIKFVRSPLPVAVQMGGISVKEADFLHVFRKNRNNSGSIQFEPGYTIKITNGAPAQSIDPGKYLFTDVTGDGLPDLITHDTILDNNSDAEKLSFRSRTNLTEAWLKDSSSIRSALKKDAGGTVMAADFEGDGESEFFVFDRVNGEIKVLAEGNDFFIRNHTLKTPLLNKATCTKVDWLGAGKEDVIVLVPGQLDAWHFNQDGYKTFTLPQKLNPAFADQVQFLDFNGDGIQDLYLNRPGEKLKIWIYDGIKFINDNPFETPVVFSGPAATPKTFRSALGFFTNQNFLQLLSIQQSSASLWNIRYDNLVLNFEPIPFTIKLPPEINSAESFRFDDLDQDGDPDLSIEEKKLPSGIIRSWYINRNDFTGKVAQVTDGFSNEVNIEYACIADTSVYSCDVNSLASDYRYFNGDYVVVKKLEYSNGAGYRSKNTTTYHYANLAEEIKGRGLAGFRSFTQKDHATGISTVTEYEYKFPITGKILRQKRSTDKGIEIFSQFNTWTFQLYDDQGKVFIQNSVMEQRQEKNAMIAIPDLQQKESSYADSLFEKLKNRTDLNKLKKDHSFSGTDFNNMEAASVMKAIRSFSSEEITYVPVLARTSIIKNELNDGNSAESMIRYEYDNLAQVVATYQNLGEGTTLVNKNNYHYLNTDHSPGGTYILGLVESDSTYVEQTKEGEEKIERSEIRFNNYNYDPATGALLEKIRLQGSKEYEHITRFRYDNTGNLIEKTIFPDSENEIKESYDYSIDRRFLVTFKNAMGYRTRYKYDVRTGKRIEESSQEGKLWVKNEYNDFGFIVKTEFPDKRSVSYSYEMLPDYQLNDENKSAAVYRIVVKETGIDPVESLYNGQGNKLATIYSSINNDKDTDTTRHRIVKVQGYDRNGNLVKECMPLQVVYQNIPEVGIDLTFKTEGSYEYYCSRYNYDALGRTTSLILPGGGKGMVQYLGKAHIEYNIAGQRKITYYNNKGEPVVIADDQGNQLQYQYDLFGNVTKIVMPSGRELLTEYDLLGRKLSTAEPGTCKTTYRYDAHDRLIEETNGNRTIRLSYDKLNRITMKITPEGTSRWYYDAQILGKTDSVVDANGNAKSYNYDNFARVISESQRIGKKTYTNRFIYDDLSRLDTRIYPNGYKIKYHYKNNIPVKISELKSDNTTKLIWQADSVNATGQMIRMQFGNGLTTIYDYDEFNNQILSIRTGRNIAGSPLKSNYLSTWQKFLSEFANVPEESFGTELIYDRELPMIAAFQADLNQRYAKIQRHTTKKNVIQQVSFTYDRNNNLLTKTDSVNKTIQGFQYDNLNRLTQVITPGKNTLSIKYDTEGNILQKSDIGLYEYDDEGTQAIKSIIKNGAVSYQFSYDEYGNITGESKRGWKINYTYFNKPRWMETGKLKTEFVYDSENQELEQRSYKSDSLTKTVLKPFSDYQEEIVNGNETAISYIHAGSSLVAIHYQQKDSLYNLYVHKDNLGSIQLLTNNKGEKVADYNYDAWGYRQPAKGNSTSLGKGFTGHEHLEDFELISCGARLYSPAIGRFLSPDPVVQEPDNLQSFNRYSYVMNNPLNYTDPSGFLRIRVKVKVKAPRIKWNPAKDIGKAVTNVGRAVGKAHEDIYNEADRFVDKNGKQIVVFTAAVAITYFSGGICSGLAGAMVQGAVFGASMRGGMTMANNGSFQDVMNSAFKGAYTGAASAAVFYGIGEAFAAAKISTEVGSAGYFGKVAAHGVAGGVQSELSGGDFQSGMLGASISCAFAPITNGLYQQQHQAFQRVAFSAAVGGLSAWATGQDVSMGIASAGFSRWFNHEMHPEELTINFGERMDKRLGELGQQAGDNWHQMRNMFPKTFMVIDDLLMPGVSDLPIHELMDLMLPRSQGSLCAENPKCL